MSILSVTKNEDAAIAAARLSRVSDPKELLRRIEGEFLKSSMAFERLERLNDEPHFPPLKIYDKSGSNVIIKECGTMYDGFALVQGADTESYDKFINTYNCMKAEGRIRAKLYTLVPIEQYGMIKSRGNGYLVMERLSEIKLYGGLFTQQGMREWWWAAFDELKSDCWDVVSNIQITFNPEFRGPQLSDKFVVAKPEGLEGRWAIALPRDIE